MKKTFLRTLPAQLALSRLLAVPILWILALRNLQTALGIGLLLALITDVLDGQAARWLKQNSELLSRLDAMVDKVLTASVIGWLILLKPEIFRDHQLLVGVALVLGLLSWGLGLFKFGRPTALHLYSGRVGGLVQAAFVLHAFLSGGFNRWLFYAAIALWCLAALEEIAVQLRYDYVDGSIRSILPFLQPRTRRPSVGSSTRAFPRCS
jgi:phosphatidylglycerophosphate synthase